MITIDAHIDGGSRSVKAEVRTYSGQNISDFATLDVTVDGAEIRFYSHRGNTEALQKIADIFNSEFSPRPSFDATGLDIPYAPETV